jgi:hypothetical protein
MGALIILAKPDEAPLWPASLLSQHPFTKTTDYTAATAGFSVARVSETRQSTS